MSTVSVVSESPFVWLFQSIMLIINHNLDHTAFCTILEALDVGTARCVVMRWAYQLGTSHDHTPCHQKIPREDQITFLAFSFTIITRIHSYIAFNITVCPQDKLNHFLFSKLSQNSRSSPVNLPITGIIKWIYPAQNILQMPAHEMEDEGVPLIKIPTVKNLTKRVGVTSLNPIN